jgi:hypothetical protein
MSIQKIYNLIFLYEYKLMLKIHNRQKYIYQTITRRYLSSPYSAHYPALRIQKTW